LQLSLKFVSVASFAIRVILPDAKETNFGIESLSFNLHSFKAKRRLFILLLLLLKSNRKQKPIWRKVPAPNGPGTLLGGGLTKQRAARLFKLFDLFLDKNFVNPEKPGETAQA